MCFRAGLLNHLPHSPSYKRLQPKTTGNVKHKKGNQNMKRTILAVAALLMMATAAMAQEQNNSSADRVQKRTELVAKKYGLDETQTKKLLELNTKYADAFGRAGAPRGGRGGRGPQMRRPQGNGMGLPAAADSTARQGRRDFGGRGSAFAERRRQMRERMEAYDKELQTIMTEEQYKSYKADMAKRAPRRDAPRGGRAQE